jgi:hypothetical protein
MSQHHATTDAFLTGTMMLTFDSDKASDLGATGAVDNRDVRPGFVPACCTGCPPASLQFAPRFAETSTSGCERPNAD